MSAPSNKRFNGKLPWLLGALALAGAALWWYTQRNPGAEGDATPDKAAGPQAGASAAAGPGGRRFAGNRVQPVSVQAARVQDMRQVVNAIGTIAANNTATVRARVEGELKAIHFKEGQQVQAGALLAEIDPRNFEIQLAQAQGVLARDAAQLKNAQIDLKRYRDLLAQDSIARQQVESQEALVNQLQGTVQADQAQVDNAKLQLSYTRITAPIAGRLGLRQVDLGNTVRASDAQGLVVITQTQPIHVVFGVPEAQLPLLNEKLKTNATVSVEAWDRDLRQRLGLGKVRSIDNAIDIPTGTIKVKAEFANADNALFPNQFVNVRMVLDTHKDALAVPTSAIQRGAIGIFVYVVKEDSTVTVRRVRLGLSDGDWTAVQGDIGAGERVVTDGADRLREGAKVDVVSAVTAAPARRASGSAGSAGEGAAPGAAPNGNATGSTPAPRASATRNAPAGNGAAPATAPQRPAPEAGTAPAASASAEGQGGGERPRWMDRLPPEVVEKLKAMSPDERRAYLQKLRERRQQQEAQ